MKVPMSDEALPDDLAQIAARFADEGVPICCIARAFKQPSDLVRLALVEAKDAGALLEIPRDDWPPTARRADRVPHPVGKLDDDTLCNLCVRSLRVTILQGSLLVLLLKRDEVTKAMLHHVIENMRAARQHQPDKIMEETDPKMVDVVICHLRKRLKKVDETFRIETLWSRGYYIAKDVRVRIFEILSEFQPA